MVSVVFVFSVPAFPGHHTVAQGGHGQDCHHVDQVDGREAGEDDQPEPEGHVDLFVDDVKAKNAEGILLVDSS